MRKIVQTVDGKSKEEVDILLREQFQNNYEVLHESYVKDSWWRFWDKTYEAKVVVFLEETKVEKKNKIKNVKNGGLDKAEDKIVLSSQGQGLISKGKNTASLTEVERKKDALFKMLDETNEEKGPSEKEKVEDAKSDKTVEELRAMIDTLVKKLEEDKGENKKILPFELEKMEAYLKEQEIDGRTARMYVEKVYEMLKDVEVLDDDVVKSNIGKLIQSRLNLVGPLDEKKEKVIALVGPTGVGKTTTLAKIGWELFKKGKTVGFITTDTFRAGAKKQLKVYGDLMEAETIEASGVKELAEALQYFQNANQVDHILIDTVGRNPMDEESIDSVNEYLNVAKPTTTALVMSSTIKVADMKQILHRFDSAKVDAMIFTKLDETYHMGSILNVFNFTKLPLLFVTDGQDITKNIYAPSEEELTEKLLSKEATIERKILRA